jgi:hypothetical protein
VKVADVKATIARHKGKSRAEKIADTKARIARYQAESVANYAPDPNFVQQITPIEEHATKMAALDEPAAEPMAAEPVTIESLEKQIVALTRDLGAFVEAGITPALAEKLADLMEPMVGSFDSETAPYDKILTIVSKEHDRKLRTKEAKNPQKVLDDERERAQNDEMESDRDDAKAEARESDERWSDKAEEWEAEWLRDNWDDEQEQQFLRSFYCDWLMNHNQEFPASDFAPAKKGGAK